MHQPPGSLEEALRPRARDLEGRILELVDTALEELAAGASTSGVLDRAIRIARLRRDGRGLVWLTMETRGIRAEAAKKRAMAETRPYFGTYEEQRSLWSDAVEEFLVERTLEQAPEREEGESEQRELVAMSIRELEVQIGALNEALSDASRPGLETLPSGAEILMRINDLRQVLARVRNRLHDYLSGVETELIVGALVSSIFEEHRTYVESRLREIAPRAFDQLSAAYRRRAEGGPEARAQALTSCRRALKTVADAVYPARAGEVLGAGGLAREMTDAKYIARLLQYVYEQTRGHGTHDLLAAQIEDLAARLDALNSLASKGVHASVNEYETNQAIIQTYLTIGDVLRIGEPYVHDASEVPAED